MKLDHEYIKTLLLSIEGIDSSRPSLGTILSVMGLNSMTDEFLLHYEVLFDYGFIAVPDGESTDNSIGILFFSENDISWMNVHLRITAKGHEFIMAMNEPEIWNVIKNEFKDSSIKTIFKVAGDLAEGFAKKKIEGILSQ